MERAYSGAWARTKSSSSSGSTAITALTGRPWRVMIAGRPVRISGYEEWRLSPEGLISQSSGRYDAADYQRQLKA